MRIVALASGGLDSTVLMWSLRADGHDVAALSMDYGQRHACEVAHAREICHEAKIPFKSVVLPGPSHRRPEIPDGHYAKESMRTTVYPNRNMFLLAWAAGYAIAHEFDAIAYAAHAGDHTIYPDCRPSFVSAMQHTLSLGNWEPIVILAPFVNIMKADIVRVGAVTGAPMDKTWSCYRGGRTHCGRCGTCVERREAFRLAGVEDPTVWATE